MKNKTNKVALVIGGSRGIGKACALRLAESGFDMCLTYRSNHEAASQTKQEIENMGRQCEVMSFDIADRETAKNLLEKRFQDSAPDVVIYNAGVARDNLFVWMTPQEWDGVMRTNLDGFYNTVQPVMFSMLRAKRGRIIVISSASGQTGRPGQVNYSASKAGLIGAAKALAREVGKKNIWVNVVSPGVIETEMTENLPKDKILPLIPVNKLGKAEDVAAVVHFLATEPNMYIHGQVIGVNGGLVL